jgi:hypothetical protein
MIAIIRYCFFLKFNTASKVRVMERERDAELLGFVWLFICCSESCKFEIDGFVVEFNG